MWPSASITLYARVIGNPSGGSRVASYIAAAALTTVDPCLEPGGGPVAAAAILPILAR
jgi:hypothetical protein